MPSTRNVPLDVVAHHEAGHVVAEFELRKGKGLPRKVSVIPDELSFGRVTPHSPLFRVDPAHSGGVDSRGRLRVEHEVVSLFAGPIAESRYTGKAFFLGPSDSADITAAVGVLDMHPDEEEAYLHLLKTRARVLLDRARVWTMVEALAAELIAQEQMSGREVRDLLTRESGRMGH